MDERGRAPRAGFLPVMRLTVCFFLGRVTVLASYGYSRLMNSRSPAEIVTFRPIDIPFLVHSAGIGNAMIELGSKGLLKGNRLRGHIRSTM